MILLEVKSMKEIIIVGDNCLRPCVTSSDSVVIEGIAEPDSSSQYLYPVYEVWAYLLHSVTIDNI